MHPFASPIPTLRAVITVFHTLLAPGVSLPHGLRPSLSEHSEDLAALAYLMVFAFPDKLASLEGDGLHLYTAVFVAFLAPKLPV